MPVDVITTVEIEKPVELVASFSGNPDNAPTWYVNIKSVEWQTEPPLRLGSRVAFVASFLGKRLAYTTRSNPGRKMKPWSCARTTAPFLWRRAMSGRHWAKTEPG